LIEGCPDHNPKKGKMVGMEYYEEFKMNRESKAPPFLHI